MRFVKSIAVLAAAVLAVGLAACSAGSASTAPSGSGPASSAPSASSAPAASSESAGGYTQILHDARPEEFNEYYLILSPDKANAGQYAASYGYSADMDAEGVAGQADMMLTMLNLSAEDVEDFAVSVSMMNTKAYAIAIVKPAEGKTEAVQKGLEAYLEGQRANMKTYLPDQYEIAAAGEVTTLPSGEVVLVCCEGSADVLSNIKAALA